MLYQILISLILSFILTYTIQLNISPDRILGFIYIFHTIEIPDKMYKIIFGTMPLSQMCYFLSKTKYGLYWIIFSLMFLFFLFSSYYLNKILNSKTRLTTSLILLSIVIYLSFWDLEQMVFSVYILFFILIFIEREKSYEFKTIYYDVLSGLAVGMTFLIRSTLLIFPVFILLYDIFTKKEKFNWRKFLIFFISSYIMLLPWVLAIKIITGKYLITELGRINLNIITGALGTTMTAEGDISKIIGTDISSFFKINT